MTINQEISVRFEVKKVLYRDIETGYSVFQAKFTNYPPQYIKDIPTSDIVLIGHFMSIKEEDEFDGSGIWVKHKIYDNQFKLSWNKMYKPVSQKGIMKFLQRFVKGIGAKTASAIVDVYKEDTLEKIREDWTNLLQVPGIGKKRAKKIHETISEHYNFEKIAMFALPLGAGYQTCMKIYDFFGSDSIRRIRENPYCLCTIPHIGFLTADKFAKNLKVEFNSPERIKQGIYYFIRLRAQNQGDLFVYKKDIISNVPNFLSNYGAYKNDKNKPQITLGAIKKALEELITEKKVIVETNKDGKDCIYLSYYNRIENNIVELLKNIIEEKKPPIGLSSQIGEFVINYEKENNFKFAEKQKDAIYMSIGNGISLLTGGPGTGKTQTINSIIKCIKTLKPHAVIELCAPTGKASKRMTELTGMEAKTIHRLIGLKGFDKEPELETIIADFLVIDESSMIDAYVFCNLLKSIDSDTRVLFVGDYEQLPSVGAGLILRDLIKSERVPTTTLTEIFRQAQESQIVMNSHKLIKGHKTTGLEPLTFDNSKKDFYFIEKSDRQLAQSYLIQSVENLINNQGYKLSDIQVLSPIKSGDLGVYDLNRLMQQKFNPPHFNKGEIRVNEISVFRVNDKVIQTTNNYDLEVFNGEVGNILSIERDGDDFWIEVDFGDKTIHYDRLSAEELLLAYVITIHKSQGSEFPVVVMPIHSTHELMLNRNLIYTAWTRAKEKVVCVGTKKALDKAIDKTDNTVRNSQIKNKLKIHLKKIIAS